MITLAHSQLGDDTMEQTAGKIFARDYFYNCYLPSFLTPRNIRTSNFLTLLGEDFRELEQIKSLGVPPYRVFSIEKDRNIYDKQRKRNRLEDLGVALYHGELADYIRTFLQHHDVSIFNLDICGSFLTSTDPILGELLLVARRNPKTVMATYSNAARDRQQLAEGLKSLVILMWLAPEVIDRLARHIYCQYRTAKLAISDVRRNEASKNMLLRHFFWLRSHMEHVMVTAYQLGINTETELLQAMAEQESAWQYFLSRYQHPFTYEQLRKLVAEQPRSKYSDYRMDVDFGEVDCLTYAANNGFYHNCYFATYEANSTLVSLNTWLVESSRVLRQNRIRLIDADGQDYHSAFGRLAVDTDSIVLWDNGEVPFDLRRITIPLVDQAPMAQTAPMQACDDELTLETINRIKELARSNTTITAREICEKLSLRLPLPRVTAHVAVARRKDKE